MTFITGACSEITCSIVLRFAERKNAKALAKYAKAGYLNFIESRLTGCHMMRDLGVGNLGTDY